MEAEIGGIKQCRCILTFFRTLDSQFPLFMNSSALLSSAAKPQHNTQARTRAQEVTNHKNKNLSRFSNWAIKHSFLDLGAEVEKFHGFSSGFTHRKYTKGQLQNLSRWIYLDGIFIEILCGGKKNNKINPREF